MYSERVSVCENAAELAAHDKDAFTLLRRQGLGASDSSIILGVNNWTKVDELIAQKRSSEITDEERAIGEKPQVRMGADVEPIILEKFIEWSDLAATKPEDMYKLKDYPYLTVNYDGLTIIEDQEIPIECKCVSMFADKYWKKENCLENWYGGNKHMFMSALTVQDHIKKQAEDYGIPPYYYTQIQQQLLGVNGTFAYLAALFIKDWTLRVFKIYEDEITQRAIIVIGQDVWNKIKD